MVEIIHRFNGAYPFGLQLQTGLTYVDLLKENLSEQQINDYRLKYKIMKQMNCPNIIKLIKILKDDSSMHLIYEYCPISLHKYIETISSRHEGQIQISIRQQFMDKFIKSISNVMDSLIHYQIKGELLINNIAIQQQQDKGYAMKIFIDPDADCMGLHLPIPTEQRNSLKEKIQQNRIHLRDHYEIEKKRLISGLDELMQSKLGFSSSKTGIKAENFTINGSKLIFFNNVVNKQQKEMKYANMESGKSHVFMNDQLKIQKADAKRELRAKNYRKIEEIKKNLAQFDIKKQSAALEVDVIEEIQQNNFAVSQNRLSFNTDIVFKYEDVAKQRRTATEGGQCLLSPNIQVQKWSFRLKNMDQKKGASLIDKKQSVQKKKNKQQLSPIETQQLTKRSDKSSKQKVSTSLQESTIENKKIKPPINELPIIQQFKDNTIIEADLQRQEHLNKPFKVRASDQTDNKKKISDIMDRLHLKSNLNIGQVSIDKNVPISIAKLQSGKIMRPNSNESQENHAYNFKNKIQAAKYKVEQVIKNYKRSRKE